MSMNSRWLAFIGFTLLCTGQAVWFVWQENALPGAILALLGSIAVLVAPSLLTLPESGIWGRERGNFSRRMWLLIPGLVLSVFAGWRGVNVENPGTLGLLALWSLGILCALLGCAPPRDYLRLVQGLAAEWPTCLGLALLVLAGLAVRSIGLEDFPRIMAEDEGYFAFAGAEIGETWQLSPFENDIQHHPKLFHTLLALSIELLGRSMTAARMPAAVLGALTIPGVYLLGRRLFDVRIGWLAALVLVVLPIHVHFSRLALNQVVDPFCAAWLFALWMGGLKNENRAELGLAGVFLGLSQYGYSAARILPLLAILWVLWLGIRTARVHFWVFAVALVTVLPTVIFLLTADEGLSPRLRDVGLGAENVYDFQQRSPLEQLTDPFLGYVQRKDATIFYGAFDPLLGWVAPIPATLGLLVALKGWREARFRLLIMWWLLTTILGGVLLLNPPEYQRFIVTVPVLAVFIALGLSWMGALLGWLSCTLTPQQPTPLMAEVWVVPMVLVIGLAGFNLKTYFLDYRDARPYFRTNRMYNLNELADTLLPNLAGYDTVWYLPARNFNLATSPILKYKVPEVQGVEYFGTPEDFPGRIRETPGSQAVVMVPSYPAFDAMLQTLDAMPETQMISTINPWTGQALVVIFTIE
jgi:4-amino-4-deoxy-L-arabinose transferase-like glycosyltransferase